MPANGKIIDLRRLLAEKFASAQTSRGDGPLITGIDVLDQTGGLGKSAITELISPQPSAGSAMLIHALLKVAKRERFFLALVDGRDSFDVESAGAAALAHLLWVRCENAVEAMKASDLLLRDGNFPLVILDLILNTAEELRRVPATSWYRLQRLVEPSATAFLVMSRHNLVPSARTKLVLENQWQLGHLQNENALAQLHLRARRNNSAACHFERSGAKSRNL